MKRLLAVLLIALCFNFSFGAQKQRRRKRRQPAKPPAAKPSPTPVINDGWLPFTSEAGRFTVLLPGTPIDKTETVPDDPGPYTTHLYVLRESTRVYLIGWVDYDPRFNFHRRSELEANRDAFIKNMNATLTNTRWLTIDNYPALEFRADSAEKTYHSRVYIVGRRPYQIAIGYPKGGNEVVAVNRFFDSFKVRPG